MTSSQQLKATMSTVSINPVTGFEPHRTSTMTMYTQARPEGDDIRSLAPVTKFNLGPGTKVIGGNLLYAYEERPYTSLTSTAQRPCGDTAGRPGSTGKTGATAGATGGIGGTGRTAAGQQASTSAPSKANNGKVVYWDGKGHHVMDAPPPGVPWSAPHLAHDDIITPSNVGTRQVAGTENMVLIGGTHRFVQPGTLGGDHNPRTASLAYGSGPADPPATIRQYAVVKAIGHKDYEAAVASLGGLATWSATQQDLRSHTETCHPGRLMSPAEHSAMGLATLRATGRLGTM